MKVCVCKLWSETEGGWGVKRYLLPMVLLFVGVCRLCVSCGVLLLGERGNLYFCNKVITNALPQGA